MRTLSVYPSATISDRVVDLLIGTIGLGGGDIWIVSPWMTDFDIDLTSRGMLLPQLGADRASLRFSELIGLCARSNRVGAVLRPPHVLVGRGDLARVVELLATRAKLASRASGDAAVRAALALLEDETERIVGSAISHRGTIEFTHLLAHHPNISVHFNPKLHAKIVVTPAAAMVGSANLTWSGMNFNDEVMVEVHDAEAITQLGALAADMAGRTFCRIAAAYDFRAELPALERAALDRLLTDPAAPAELVSVLNAGLSW